MFHKGRFTSGVGMAIWRTALRGFLLAVDQVHEQADDDAERHGSDRPSNAELQAQNPGGQDDRQDVDRRAGVEKCRRRAQARAHLVDAGKQGQHRTRAHRQNRSRDRSDAIGEELVGPGAEILHDRSLADENADGPGDEERRDQA